MKFLRVAICNVFKVSFTRFISNQSDTVLSEPMSFRRLIRTVPVVALFKFGDIVSDLFDVIVCESFSIIFHPIDWQLNGLHCNFHFTDFYTL